MRSFLVGDRYEICRRVGAGGMARVYLAWDTRLRLWCALKVMTPRAAADGVLRGRFVHEARALARLSHPHLVRLFDLVDRVETPYLAMEYLEGGTVAGRLLAGPIPERQAVLLAADAAAALQVAHDAGVVHRDVKPQNLLLDRAGTVKVSDFGVAIVESETRLTGANVALGTLVYMAPEQQRDAARVDHRVDVYSLGATLWAMLTGRRPTPLQLPDRDEALRALRPPLEALVRPAVEPDPAARLPTARAFEQAARALAATLPAVDEPPLVPAPELVPATPPTVADFELETDEFAGTLRPWRSRVTPEPAPAARVQPSSVRTIGIDELVAPPTAPEAPAPPVAEATSVKPTPGWRSGTSLGLAVLFAALCAGGCAALSCAGWHPGR